MERIWRVGQKVRANLHRDKGSQRLDEINISPLSVPLSFSLPRDQSLPQLFQ